MRRRPGWLVVHAHQLTAGLAYHPATDVDDEPGLLGEIDEPIGRVEFAAAVLPTHQRLRTAHPARLQVDLGLEEHHQLAQVEGRAQLLFHHHPGVGRFAERLVEHGDPVAPGLLRPVHRHVGLAHQLLGVAGVGGECDAEAGGGQQVVTVGQERRAERLHDSEPGPEGLVRFVEVAHDDDELVAAEPAHQVACAHGGLQSVGGSTQQLVADRVPHAHRSRT